MTDDEIIDQVLRMEPDKQVRLFTSAVLIDALPTIRRLMYIDASHRLRVETSTYSLDNADHRREMPGMRRAIDALLDLAHGDWENEPHERADTGLGHTESRGDAAAQIDGDRIPDPPRQPERADN